MIVRGEYAVSERVGGGVVMGRGVMFGSTISGIERCEGEWEQ